MKHSRRTVIVLLMALCLMVSSWASDRDIPSDLSIPTGSESTTETRWVMAVITIIGVAIGATRLAMSIAALFEDEVGIQNVNAIVAGSHFHVGDERQVIVSADVSFGALDGNDKGLYIVEIFGVGIHGRKQEYVTKASLGGSTRIHLECPFPVEGQAAGIQTILAEIRIVGEDGHWYGDKQRSVYGCKIIQVGVADPFDAPVVDPKTKTFDHPGGQLHTMSIRNNSSKTGWVQTSRVNKAEMDFTIVPAGKDGGPAFEKELVTGWVGHEGCTGHTVDSIIPFTCEAKKLGIALAGPKCWQDSIGYDYALKDGCRPSDNTTLWVNPDVKQSAEPRGPSHGQRSGGPVRRLSDETNNPTPVLAGIPCTIHDPVSDTSYTFYMDSAGTWEWHDIVLGPSVDLYLNTDAYNPAFEVSEILGMPLSLLAIDTLLPDAFRLVEALAPPITGELSASDGGEVWIALSSAKVDQPEIPLDICNTGEYRIEGVGALSFDGTESMLKLEPIRDFNRTMVSYEPVYIPVDMTQDTVDLGSIVFDVLPHSTSPEIAFEGTLINGLTELPVEGLVVQILNYSDGSELIASTTTDADGYFSMVVPNGPALLFIPNLIDFDLHPMAEPDYIDFGANGYDVLDIGVGDLPIMSSPDIKIEHVEQAFQGQYQTVSVTTENSLLQMGGFDFLIGYDGSHLKPGETDVGQLLEDCDWEYFTYRHGSSGNCDYCPSGLMRIIAIAEQDDGPNHPACFGPDNLETVELFTISFLVSNDRTIECQHLPIYFFWNDCGDNVVSSVDGQTTYIDRAVFQWEHDTLWNENDDVAFPENARLPHVGTPDYCLNPDPDKPSAIRLLNFINGGINVICLEEYDARGDINLNEVCYEVADAVLFANYFVYGLGVFTVNVDGQVAATDANADGMTLSVADLVYLIRVIVGDAAPYPKLAPLEINCSVEDGVFSVASELGAAYVIVDGDASPVLLADKMEMKYNFDGNTTRILVFSMDRGAVFSGEFLQVTGDIIHLELASYDGAPVGAKLLPTKFALHQNYPNPFNATTRFSFAVPVATDYTLTIYNINGQAVEEFSGHSAPGLVDIDWNADEFATGVYLYKLTAGDFTDTKKMILVK